MGEHEIDKIADGFHEDIAIEYFESHKAFDDYLWINDIAMIYLERDVEFTGFTVESFFTIFFLK